MSAEQDTQEQTRQIAEAAKLAFDNSQYFPQVLDTVVAVSLSQPIASVDVQLQCLNFLHQAYHGKRIVSAELRCKSSTKMIDMLSRLLLMADEDVAHKSRPPYTVAERCLEILAASYSLMFKSLVDEPDKPTWTRLCRLRDFAVSKWPSAYPLLPYNRDTDWGRAISCKNAITRLIGKIIQTHLPPATKDAKGISVAIVTKDHPFLFYNSALGSQGQALLDKLFSVANSDILLPTAVFSTLMTVLLALFKTRPNLVSAKFLNFVLGYEAQFKRDPKFDKNALRLRMNRRFNDRLDKITISMLLNRGFIDKDPSLKGRFENKLRYLVDTAAEQRKKGPLAEDDDEADKDAEAQRARKKRKLDKKGKTDEPIDFYNESHIARNDDYRSIFSLLPPGDGLESFDMSSIPAAMLPNMVALALTKVDTRKLVKALNIVADRYIEIVTRGDYVEPAEGAEPEGSAQQGDASSGDANNNAEDESAEDEEEEAYTVPMPKQLDINQKKEQMKTIINNFITLSQQNVKENVEEVSSTDGLGKVAISKWKSDSWIKILSRLGTRGTVANEEMSAYVREAIFGYLQTDIKSRMTEVIEWLNEEYYHEIVSEEEEKNDKPASESPHASYLEYAAKILDSLIPILDSSDRKVFIRLLSEMPYLNKDLIAKIDVICRDPSRSQLGFQSILYLIMFRPPVFSDCIEVLKDLLKEGQETQNEQLEKSCQKYLTKYAPQSVSVVCY